MGTRKRTSLVIAMFVLSLAGLAISTVLTMDHQAYLLDPSTHSGTCKPGSGCEISRSSVWSELPISATYPGLPISLIGFSAYLAVAFLANRRRTQKGHCERRLLMALGVLMSLYSILLATISLVAQGKLCPWCTGLYVVNLSLCAVAYRDLGEPLAEAFRGVWNELRSASALWALSIFMLTTIAGYGVYAAPIMNAGDVRQKKDIAHAPRVVAGKVVSIDTEGRATKGARDAAVHIIEFADFECPFCRDLYEAIDAIRKSRPKLVKVTFLHYPLDNACNPQISQAFHPRACLLAKAAECAHVEGRFFDLAPWLFANGKEATGDALATHVTTLGMDPEAFSACLDDEHPAIGGDISKGVKAGVQATPTFFINGRKVEGRRTRAVIEAMVDALLESSTREK